MLRPALDRDTANSMLWPSLNHHMHGLPEALPRVRMKLYLVSFGAWDPSH